MARHSIVVEGGDHDGLHLLPLAGKPHAVGECPALRRCLSRTKRRTIRSCGNLPQRVLIPKIQNRDPLIECQHWSESKDLYFFYVQKCQKCHFLLRLSSSLPMQSLSFHRDCICPSLSSAAIGIAISSSIVSEIYQGDCPDCPRDTQRYTFFSRLQNVKERYSVKLM